METEKRILKIEIECGSDTCSSKTNVGKFCKWVRVNPLGGNPKCFLFDEKLLDSKGDGTGWLLRCETCLKSE